MKIKQNADGTWTLTTDDGTDSAHASRSEVFAALTASAGYTEALTASALERGPGGEALTAATITVTTDDTPVAADPAPAAAAPLDMGDDEDADEGPAVPLDPANALRPETWTSGPDGICQAGPTGPTRDFTGCLFTWRELPLPLMIQTANVGHYEAELGGFITAVSLRQDGGLDASGTFLNNDPAADAVQIMQAGGRFWCSLDPSEYVSCEFECTDFDEEWGFCMEGVDHFTAYEMAGLTLLPFQGFEACHVVLAGATPAVAASVTAALAGRAPDETVAPINPPPEWFRLAPPEVGDARLVRQPPRWEGDTAEIWAVPLTVTDDGQVFGHLGPEGTCHIGYADRCITIPSSPTNYARFHLHAVETATGEIVNTGNLVVGCDHALGRLRAPEARDHYANASLAWADVRMVDTPLGPWACGTLKPDVTVAQVRLIRACALSGDWRDHGDGALDLIVAQLVTTPGFPIAREAVAASGWSPSEATLAYQIERGRLVAMTAAGIVVRAPEETARALVAAGCSDCARQAAQRRDRVRASRPAPAAAGIDQRAARTMLAAIERHGEALAEVTKLVRALDLRTRHLSAAAAAEMVTKGREALARPTSPG